MIYRMDGMPIRLDGDGATFEEIAPKAPFAELIRIAVALAAALGRLARRVRRERVSKAPPQGGLTPQM